MGVSSPNPKLIADLARLASRYSSEEWNVLLEFVRDPARQGELVLLIEQLAAVSQRSSQRRSAGSKAAGIRQELERVHEEDPQRADLLSDVWSRLRRRVILPEMRSLRSFAEAIGMKGMSASKREEAVAEVMKYLVGLTTSELVAAMRQVVTVEQGLGEEYGRWVRLILGSGDPSDGPYEPLSSGVRETKSQSDRSHMVDKPPTS